MTPRRRRVELIIPVSSERALVWAGLRGISGKSVVFEMEFGKVVALETEFSESVTLERFFDDAVVLEMAAGDALMLEVGWAEGLD